MINKLAITLRPTVPEDLDILFTFQLDKESRYLAAFMPEDSTDKAAYMVKYTRLLNDSTVNNQTIIFNNKVVGSIARFVLFGNNEITYWIDKQFWGKNIATAALKKMLMIDNCRPVFGRVAFDNVGSQKVLERCGFVKVATDKGFASARQTEIEEYIYKLT